MPSPHDSSETSRDASHVTTFDPADERPSEALVAAVAAFRGSDPAELSPLYGVVEPDALDSLVEHANRVDAAGSHRVWFTYEGFDVGVRSDGRIRLREASTAGSESTSSR
jgi:hypothetical protein